MTKPKKKRFSFGNSGGLKTGSQGKDVDSLQTILASLGYLRGSYEPGRVCGCTEKGIRRFQRFYGLKVDGIAGPRTKAFMELPRCGVPDLPTDLTGSTPLAPYVHVGCSYDRNQLTYAFLNGTGDLPGQREREIVRNAFQAWAKVADLQFNEVQSSQSPDFRIAWRKGNHGDGYAFDGPGNKLAHAFFPPPCGGPNAGDFHFDEAELWAEDGAAESAIILKNVAIHEIGHLLGLSHSQDDQAIMYAYYSPERENLADDDIQGVVALYGAPSESQQLVLTARSSGTLERTSDAMTYNVEVPGALAISIDGPGEADFDLYVRKDEPPTTEDWDYRAYTVSSDEKILVPVEAGGTYHIMVRSYEGSGNFEIKVEPSFI